MTDTRQRVQSILQDIFDDETIALRDDLTAAEVENWNSITHIDLIVKVEKEFRVRFTTVEVTSLKNAGQLVALVDRKRMLVS